MPPKAATSSRPASGARPATSADRPRSGAPGTAGGKRAAAAAPPPAAAAEELKNKAEALERNLRNEELARNYMQLERDKIHNFWDVTKRELGDRKTELRLKDRELEEVQDRHALELKVYKQRVKHLLFEHQDGLARLKAQGEAALKSQAEVYNSQEVQLAEDKRRLKQHVREQELSSEELIKQFRLDNAKQVSRLRQEFEAQARAIQTKYEEQLRGLHQAAEEHYAADLAALEESKSAHIAALMARHEAAYADMRAYYAGVTRANLDLIKALKEEIAEMKAAEAAREKLVGDVVRENKRLAQPLAQAVDEAEELRAALAGAERDRAALASAKARLATAEKRGRALEWELEVTQQRLERVQSERDGMQCKLDTAVLGATQRAALRNTVLERHLEAITSELALAQQAQQDGSAVGSAAGSRRGSNLPPRSSRAASAAARAAAGGDGSASRRSSKQAGGAAGGSLDWVCAMLEAALHTPLPDTDADILEDDAPKEMLQAIAELAEAASTAEAAPAVTAAASLPSAASSKRSVVGDGSSSPLAALQAKLSEAALGATAAAVDAAGGCGAGER